MSTSSVTSGSTTAPAVNAPSRPSRRFQILSLDGGGYKGLFTVAVLTSLEEDLGVSITDHFDLLAGTSTGGIIALALGAGLRPADILDFYIKEGSSIFPAGWWRKLRQVVRTKYRAVPLEAALGRVFGKRCLWESKIPLCIPSYDLRSDDVHLFRTPTRNGWHTTGACPWLT
jgi:uncharacterized protein